MRSEGGITGESKVVCKGKFHSLCRCTKALTNMGSD